MLHFDIVPKEIIESYLNDFFNRKLIFNNYFGIDLSDVDFIKTDYTLILRKPYVGFYRVYILSEDEDDLSFLLKDMDKNHAINIPTKKEIFVWDKVLSNSGFYNFALYERYRNKKVFEKNGDLIDYYAVDSDLEEIKKGLFEAFSPITGWLPNDTTLISMIKNRQIMVNRDDQGMSGIIVYTISGKKADLNAWIGLRGQGIYLFLNMFNLLAEKGVRIANAWINQKNTSVKKMYKIMGFEPDGLKDYIYIK